MRPMSLCRTNRQPWLLSSLGGAITVASDLEFFCPVPGGSMDDDVDTMDNQTVSATNIQVDENSIAAEVNLPNLFVKQDMIRDIQHGMKPMFFPFLLGNVFQFKLFSNLTSLIILIGVITDVSSQIRGYLVAQNYESFKNS